MLVGDRNDVQALGLHGVEQLVREPAQNQSADVPTLDRRSPWPLPHSTQGGAHLRSEPATQPRHLPIVEAHRVVEFRPGLRREIDAHQ
jgi:hypothetical protein